jgi:hypothetical protein
MTETETETVSCGIIVWKYRSGEWRRRDEERSDLDLSGVHVRRSHYRVLLIADPVERTERVRRSLTSELGISVAHDRVPYFDGTTAFEYIYPYRAPINPNSNAVKRVRVFLINTYSAKERASSPKSSKRASGSVSMSNSICLSFKICSGGKRS